MTDWLPMLLDVMNEPPEAGALAVAALPPMLKPEAVPVLFVPTKVEGVPKLGVTNVGLLANTFAPEPVSSVKAAAKFALEGVAKNVATLAAKPETPVEIGSPVQLVSVPEAGVPSAGVVNEGEFRWVFCWVKFVPSLHTVIVLRAGMATPVPAAVVLPMTVEL